MTQLWKAFSFLLCGGLLASCTMTGPKFTPLDSAESQHGVVYIYRPSNYDMGLMSALISLDGKPVAVLENAGYVALFVEPSKHTITQKWKAGVLGNSDLEGATTSTVVDVQYATPAYVSLKSNAKRLESRHYNVVAVGFKWQLAQVAADQALPEISECRKVGAI